MLSFPNAKINIGLNILEKRSDGYHNLSSCFYPVGLCDVLEIVPAGRLEFHLSGITPGNGENLCVKAFRLLQAEFGLPPVAIYLQKNIPVGAGLGGGSSDAAFTIKMLNSLFDIGLSPDKEEAYSRQLGSDCAFFIQNEPVYCYGKGDEFETTPVSLKGKKILLVNPAIHISTAEAYAHVRPHHPDQPLWSLLNKPIAEWKGLIKNDFEESAFQKHPVLADIKEKMYEMGALYASMSGSGSTLYGIFDVHVPLHTNFTNYFVWQEELR